MRGSARRPRGETEHIIGKCAKRAHAIRIEGRLKYELKVVEVWHVVHTLTAHEDGLPANKNHGHDAIGPLVAEREVQLELRSSARSQIKLERFGDSVLEELEFDLFSTGEMSDGLGCADLDAILQQKDRQCAFMLERAMKRRTRRYPYTVTPNSSLRGLPGPFEADDVRGATLPAALVGVGGRPQEEFDSVDEVEPT